MALAGSLSAEVQRTDSRQHQLIYTRGQILGFSLDCRRVLIPSLNALAADWWQIGSQVEGRGFARGSEI